MRKRTKLKYRQLPQYYRGEEIMNMVTHIIGGGFAVIALTICVVIAVRRENTAGIISGSIYGITMVNLYAISSIYHGLLPNTAKKVLQILDHCSIYFLIAGTYTPILVCGISPVFPSIAWWLLILEWALAIIAATLTAIDLKLYSTFSMICYILMGWAIIFFIPATLSALSLEAFLLILSGGILYTIGAVIYGIGSKIHWMHSIFHIFVVLGSILHFLAIVIFIL